MALPRLAAYLDTHRLLALARPQPAAVGQQPLLDVRQVVLVGLDRQCVTPPNAHAALVVEPAVVPRTLEGPGAPDRFHVDVPAAIVGGRDLQRHAIEQPRTWNEMELVLDVRDLRGTLVDAADATVDIQALAVLVLLKLDHAAEVIGREAEVHDEYPAAAGPNRGRQSAPGARAGERLEPPDPRTHAPGVIAPAEPLLDRMRAAIDPRRAVEPSHLTEAPVIGMQSPIDPAEMVTLQMRVEKAPESQIEAVAVLVWLADEAQRLERFRKFRSQPPEPERIGNGLQRWRLAHIALPARIVLRQRVAVHHVQVLVDAHAGDDSCLSVRAKPAHHVSVVEAVVADHCERKRQRPLVHQSLVECRQHCASPSLVYLRCSLMLSVSTPRNPSE